MKFDSHFMQQEIVNRNELLEEALEIIALRRCPFR